MGRCQTPPPGTRMDMVGGANPPTTRNVSGIPVRNPSGPSVARGSEESRTLQVAVVVAAVVRVRTVFLFLCHLVRWWAGDTFPGQGDA